jgi:hypothetical protein
MFSFIFFYSSFKYVLVGDYDSPFCWNIVFGILCIRSGFEPYQFDPFFLKYNHSSNSKHFDGYWAYTYNSLSVILSANIIGAVARDGFEQIEELPGKNDIDPTLDGRQERDTKNLTVLSTWRLHNQRLHWGGSR